ncbi:hypothetical protein [Burkholderia ubonensis]|uniref:hypothetical protein n=1 Tax=Burkholderia ubonensis TaxID=101571 RepID=UPI0012FBAAFD|nr:hypothetical protein [Burkholderia ubonensis]
MTCGATAIGAWERAGDTGLLEVLGHAERHAAGDQPRRHAVDGNAARRPFHAKAPSLADIPFIPGRRLPVFRGSRSRAVLLWMGEELRVGVATKNARTITERIAGGNKGMD